MAAGDTLTIWGALNNEPPGGVPVPASYDWRTENPVLDFDDTEVEAAVFRSIMPGIYAGGSITVNIFFSMTIGTTGQVIWGGQWQNQAAGNDIDSTTYASEQTIGQIVPGTAGLIEVASITFTSGQIAGVSANDPFRFRVERKAGSDDAPGDAELIAIQLVEA